MCELDYRARTVQLPVTDLRNALKFYADVVGWRTCIRDADRYAVVEAGDLRVALAAGPETLDLRTPAVAVKVPDPGRAASCLAESGAAQVTLPVSGRHETRALVRDPFGHPIILYTG